MAVESLYSLFGDASGPYRFQGEQKDGRWWEGEVLGSGQSPKLVGRVSRGILNFVLEAPPWFGPWLQQGIDSGELAYEGSYKDGRRWSGRLVHTSEGMELARVEEGDIRFDGLWPSALIESLARDGWIPRNWVSGWEHARNSPEWMELCCIAVSNAWTYSRSSRRSEWRQLVAPPAPGSLRSAGGMQRERAGCPRRSA